MLISKFISLKRLQVSLTWRYVDSGQLKRLGMARVIEVITYLILLRKVTLAYEIAM